MAIYSVMIHCVLLATTIVEEDRFSSAMSQVYGDHTGCVNTLAMSQKIHILVGDKEKYKYID
jgi:hypothetical protein